MVVDHQAHWTPPGALETLIGRDHPPRVELRDGVHFLELAPGFAFPVGPDHVDLDRQLSQAEANGVDVLVSSPNLLGEVLDLEAGEAAEVIRVGNELTADAQRRHPDRFVGLAMLPMQKTETALEVLTEADSLGLGGVCMLPTIAGAPIASEETMPIFERIEELGMPLFLHPEVKTTTFPQAPSLRAEIGVNWMAATSLAVLSLIDGGVLEACPQLVVVHPHLGGVLPWLHGRLAKTSKPGQASVAELLRTRFYVDSAAATPGALRFAADLYGADRVLYASDWPWMPMDGARAYVAAEGIERVLDNQLPGFRYPSRA
jgi:aminocarboxymuconate-semialdehyde decarboxylase